MRPDGRRSVGGPSNRWKDAVEADFSKIGIQQWEMQAHDRRRWRAIVDAAKTHPKLWDQERRRRGYRQESCLNIFVFDFF